MTQWPKGISSKAAQEHNFRITHGFNHQTWRMKIWQCIRMSAICKCHSLHSASLVGSAVKNLPAMQETWVPSLGWEDLLEKETATDSSTLVWRIPWTEEPGRLQSMGSQRVGHDWATSLSLNPPNWSIRPMPSYQNSNVCIAQGTLLNTL